MKIAHLIGNGPSKAHYPRNNTLGDVFGCNLGSDDITMGKVFIHDNRVFEHIINHKVKLQCPVVLREHQFSRFHKSWGDLVKVHAVMTDTKTVTSGHMGILWLMRHGYDEIHLWGFDSIWAKTVESDSKGKIDGSNPNPRKLPEWELKNAELFGHAKSFAIGIYAHKNVDDVVPVGYLKPARWSIR